MFSSPASEFVYIRTYSRWINELNRREKWEETVNRYMTFIQEERGNLIPPKVLRKIKEKILNFEVMPSMRALWAAGEAARVDNTTLYNCSFAVIDSAESFAEALYVLMCGTGDGFSVQSKYIVNSKKMPIVPILNTNEIPRIIRIEDSKAGWADSVKSLIESLYRGKDLQFEYNDLRSKGAKLKTMGGRSSGPVPLIVLHSFIREIFSKAQERKLTTLECHDMRNQIAESVVVGGVRRCMSEMSMVSTPYGLIPIKDLRIGDSIETSGKIHKVIDFINSGKQKVLEIRHFGGVIKCTENHQIAVFIDKNTIEFKLAKDLKKSDLLCWDYKGFTGNNLSLPNFKHNDHFNAKYVDMKINYPTDNFAWLIGLIHGDGYISPKGVEITAHSSEMSNLKKANDIFKEVFSVEGNISKGNGDCVRLRINSVDISRWMALNVKIANTDIRIPNWIKNSTKSIRYAYLAGLLDSDGRIREDNVFEQCTTVYEEYAKDVMQILLGLGLICKNHKYPPKPPRQGFNTINILGNTSRLQWLKGVKPHSVSNKCDNAEILLGCPIDFKYNKEMYPDIPGYSKVNYITLQRVINDVGVLDYYPSPIVSIDQNNEIQTYDIAIEGIEKFTADGVLVHNSSQISLSDLDDIHMRNAKIWPFPIRRTMANNSAVYETKPSAVDFLKEWSALASSGTGERGIFNLESAKKNAPKRRNSEKLQGVNPCSEILLRNKGLCNLSEVVINANDDLDSLLEKVETATWIGVIQSTFTYFPYLSKEWKENCEEERLLGVSLTGQMDNPELLTVDALKAMKAKAIKVAKHASQKMGINMPTAITCVKPSGTVSQLVNSASGIHARYANFYIRRYRISATDPLLSMIKDQNINLKPENGQENLDPIGVSTWVVSFPIKSPKGCVTRHDFTAIDQLEWYKKIQTNWCEHNASMTVYVKDEEWFEVGNWVYKNWDIVNGVSFLPFDGGHYKQAPYEEITEEQYNKMIADFKQIDYTQLHRYELEDNTEGAKSLACSGDKCDIT